MNVQCKEAKIIAGKADTFSDRVKQSSRSTMATGVSGLLRREFRFLHKPLNIWSRLLLLAAAVTIGVSLFFPLWKMHLVAPQYSDGLDLYIFPYNIHAAGLNGHHLTTLHGLY